MATRASGRAGPSSSGPARPCRRSVAVVIIVAIALPFFSLRLGSSDQGNDAAGTTTRQAYDLLSKGFGPGFNGPLELVADVHGPDGASGIAAGSCQCHLPAGVARVAPAILHPRKERRRCRASGGVPDDVSAGCRDDDPCRQSSTDRRPQGCRRIGAHRLRRRIDGSLRRLRKRALARSCLSSSESSSLLSFLLLALVFRSLLIPLISSILNIFSIGAAFGVLVAVFQWGWLGGLIGVNKPGPIESFLPVMLFAIVFGLSMDYQVFLVTRIHEEWLKTGDNRLAVRNGLATTGKTITAAALIMILVFGSFILGGERVIKEFGLGLAGGVLIDAIVIRMAIVPSLMTVFGKANWWFPRWLDWLPNIGLEQSEDESETSEKANGQGSQPVSVPELIS